MGRPRLPLIESTCEECGKAISYPRYQSRTYCSPSCAAKGNYKKREHPMTGERNPRFNNGLCISGGRCYIVTRDYKTVFYYRAVMEAHLKRHLDPSEIVHHIDGDGMNDNIENLQLVTRSEHIKIHRADLLAAKERKRDAA